MLKFSNICNFELKHFKTQIDKVLLQEFAVGYSTKYDIPVVGTHGFRDEIFSVTLCVFVV